MASAQSLHNWWCVISDLTYEDIDNIYSVLSNDWTRSTKKSGINPTKNKKNQKVLVSMIRKSTSSICLLHEERNWTNHVLKNGYSDSVNCEKRLNKKRELKKMKKQYQGKTRTLNLIIDCLKLHVLLRLP
jgi:hypothetical protein